MHSKTKGLLWIFGTFLVVAALIWGIPEAAKLVPWSTESKIAKHLGRPDNSVDCHRAESETLLKKLVARIFPVMRGDSALPVSVEVVSGKMMNAFASLGGKIYVYDGLLQKAESPEELAGVIAHEMEHVRHRHVIQGVFSQIFNLVAITFATSGSGMNPGLLNFIMNMKFSRGQEAQADEEGLRRLQAAKVDVAGFQKFFNRQAESGSIPAMLSDHPDPKNRAEMVQRFLGSPTTPIMSAEEWLKLKRICER